MFYTEIHNGHQKWRRNNLGEKSPDDSVDTLGLTNFAKNHSVVHHFRDQSVLGFFSFNADIQDMAEQNDRETFLAKITSWLCRYPDI